MANYSQKLQNLRLDEQQRVDEFLAALGRGIAALGRTKLGGKIGRGLGSLSSEQPKGAYKDVLGKWNPISGRQEGGISSPQERLAAWRKANQARKTEPPPLPITRSDKTVARSAALRGLGKDERNTAAQKLIALRKDRAARAAAGEKIDLTSANTAARKRAYSQAGEQLGAENLKTSMKKNLRGAALTSRNKRFDRTVGTPLRTAMDYAHKINFYNGNYINEVTLAYLSLLRQLN